MGLFPELDEDQTIKNVKYYFEHEFPRLKARSHMNIASIQSPSFDTVGTSGTTRNTQEDKIMGQLWAIDLVKATYKVVDRMPDGPDNHYFKTIMKYCFLYGEGNTSALEQSKYESSRYFECKRMAMLYFADAFSDYYDMEVNVMKTENSGV
ncbi:ArpU family phage packaging/lysis transcriptional regulator [Companilactobacillus bobalius]|nr:ArpU family phage packaging/lysis transcriptional regulator [Companilactobacillus bobalius]KAE9560109.1 hypothetical protein ATN92_07730 [Companilactobacillus bobalius]OVE94933.1 hypothetical protein LKACC16343_02783 [Companilactobacillus bobalius]GEO58689.1 hypothetical protein LBO01_18180 [Companilactobacillus paralimentarius]